MKSFITYIKPHVNQTRQDCLLFVVKSYGKSTRSLWRALGYDSVSEFDSALFLASISNLPRENKRQ
ncbi:hypothetical protein [Psychromonas ossibalaenae]|uniref:hypothetical protein n=1 Tax=Psychromonas ossibalaenae TaxID=444922 RepID=UPI001B7FBB1A|nr:hypothetical protein [Psychromonas ossibalaenae]